MDKTILYDLEVSQSVVSGYGQRWNYRVVKILRPQQLMSYAWKELGEKKIHFVHRHNFKHYRDFVKSLHTVLDYATISVAHNGGSFDDKVANTLFVTEGLTPPKPRKTVDTRKEASRWFRFESNKLDDLGEFLGFGRKESVGYGELEEDLMSDNPSKKTIRLMKKYNCRDVELLEKIYLKIRPFITSHPNMGDIRQTDHICPKCGSSNVHKRGYAHRRNGDVQRYRCMDCGGWCNESRIGKEGRLVNG